jgi:hypothetical protein
MVRLQKRRSKIMSGPATSGRHHSGAMTPRQPPKDPSVKFMFLIHSVSEGPPSQALLEAMHQMAAQEVAAGRMIYDGGLAPASLGMQLRLKSGKVVVLDGPFTETKEMLGGFAIFELPDMAAAEASARDFLALHQRYAPAWEGVCEIREIAGSNVELIRAGS